MEYTFENMKATVLKIKKDENLSWKQMAELFGFETASSVNQYGTGSKRYSPKSFMKHFGAIEQYWPEEKAEKQEVRIDDSIVEEKPENNEAPVVKEEEGIVLSCETVAELAKLLDIIGYRMEVLKSK